MYCLQLFRGLFKGQTRRIVLTYLLVSREINLVKRINLVYCPQLFFHGLSKGGRKSETFVRLLPRSGEEPLLHFWVRAEFRIPVFKYIHEVDMTFPTLLLVEELL